MKHWVKVTENYGGTFYSPIRRELEAYVEVDRDGAVSVGMTPRGDSTSYLTLDELRELVIICEGYEV